MKYIRFDDPQDTIVMFPVHVNHKTMARYYGDAPALSAGFVNLCNGRVECYGHSLGLNLSSKEEDSKILQKQIVAGRP